jgi:hypothetical protein
VKSIENHSEGNVMVIFHIFPEAEQVRATINVVKAKPE